MNENMKTVEYMDEPWTKPWPVDGLESVNRCPVCGETDREILHPNLVDNVFRVAPGKWKLWQCEKCSSAYLDPRPTRESMHLAYANYYTHQEITGKDDYASLNPFRKLRRRLVNGYTNWRYSTHTQPSSAFGVLAAFAMPNLRRILDRQYRNMPRLPKDGGRLLDVGCGNGSFLSLAQACGWEVVGLDPDPKVAANAAEQGLTIHEGGIEYFDGKTELFDVITLNHVIEHVHDPVKVLKACHTLLKPGGQLWLETPNINSFGHARFQKNWRGLETPRHLVLFSRRSITRAYINAGFLTPHNRARPRTEMFKSSFAMENGYSPYQTVALPRTLRLLEILATYAGLVLPSRREFLTVSVRKVELKEH